jgi:hypothetical protein
MSLPMPNPTRRTLQPAWMCLALALATGLVLFLPHEAAAIYHELGWGEPFAMTGKRMAFTTWYWVRPGQFDWQDDQGKSVFADRRVMAKPDDPHTHWHEYDLPHGIRLVCEPAQKGEFPIKPEYPWEKDGIEITSILQLKDKIMVWGNCRPGGGCYFESKDGTTWERPKLGLVEFEGSKENNLVPSVMGRVCYDPTARPEERFKAASNSDYDPQAFEEYKKRRPWQRMATETDPGRVHAVFGYVSPDGHRWTKLPEPISVEASDGGQYVYYDPKLKNYVMYLRTYQVGPRAEDYPLKHERYHQFAGRRVIGRSESADFKNFPLSEIVIETSTSMPPTDTFYFNVYTTVPGAPENHLMFPTRYIQAKDGCAIDLYTSQEGKVWHLAPGSPVLEMSDYGQWDGGAIWAPNVGLAELGDGSWVLPFRGDPLPHKYPRGYYAERWGLAVWPKGRLMGIEAADEGRFITFAFLAPGRRARINALTSRAGEVLIEAADFYGKPIPGRTFEDAIPIIGDQHKTLVRWKEHDDLGVEAGEPLMLRFRMRQAKLYFVDFE